ncbi:MAG: site-specific integrase [Lachnospiraceae bacterium]|nr:site-specific integrase [Lachnospiraceae bacterium]
MMTLMYPETLPEKKISFLYDPSLSEAPLSSLESCGIIDSNEYRRYITMVIREKVSKIHDHAISKGMGKDGRWFTNVRDPVTGKLKRVAGKTEEEVYRKLYDFYFVTPKKKKALTLRKIYPEWLQYRAATAGKANSVHRQDTDYRRFYLNEPLSKKILDTPVTELTRAVLKKWECEMIRKHNMTYKRATNVFSIIKQMMDYLVDSENLTKNTAREVRLDKTIYKPVNKATASSQIFYPDEMEALMKLSYRKAQETQDENYLAIPLIRLLGLRIGECLALSFSDFDSSTNRVHVHSSLCVKDELNPDGTWAGRSFQVEDSLKKGAPPRDLLGSDEVFELVKKIRVILFKKGIHRERLFETATQSMIQMKLYRMCDELGIERRSPHKLRKTYISMLLNHGFDPDFVRQQAGHKQLQTTLNNYTYSTTRDSEIVGKLNEVLAL